MIALLITALVPLTTGCAISRALHLCVPRAIIARIASWFLIGVASNGLLLYVLGVLGIRLGAAVYIIIPAASAVVLLVLLVRPSKPTVERPPQKEALLPSFLFYVPLLLLFCTAAILPTRDYDGRVTWIPKARAIVREQTLAGPFFQGRLGLNLHNRYPLLLPLNVAGIMTLSGRDDSETGRWLYVLIAISALLSARGLLVDAYPVAGVWVFAGAAWLPVLLDIEGGALSAYSDWAVCGLTGLGALSLASENHRGGLRTASLAMAALVLTKSEGTAIAIAIFLAALAARRLRSRSDWVVLGAPTLFAAALLAKWRATVPAAYDEQYGILLRGLLSSRARFPGAVGEFFRHAGEIHEWGLFWPATAIALLLTLLTARRSQVVIPAVVLAVTTVAYLIAYTVTSWNIAELAAVSTNRLLTQLIVPACWILVIAFDTASHAPIRQS